MTTGRWERLQEICDRASALAPELREAFLREACADDPAMVDDARTLIGLNSEKPERPSELSERVPISERISGSNSGPVPPAGAAIDFSAQRFGAWRIVGALGHGGMGSVHLAERVDGAFQARAALKLLNPWLLESGYIERFLRERQILASLQHPGIAALLDGGVSDHGVPFLVMERVDGVPISEFISARKLSIEDTVRLFLKVCAAVQFAHQNLVIHRDIKPPNILVTANGDPKLLDFGIAKVLGTEPGPEHPATRIMTPDYASPEQIQGKAVSTASDVYALAMVLYEVLTGGRAPTRSGALTDPVLVRPSSALTRPGVDTDLRDWRQRQKRLRGDLDTVLLKALALDPERRYATVEKFADDLQRTLESRPIAAQPESLNYRMRLFVQRHRFGVATAGGFVVLLLASTIALVYFSLQLRQERDRASAEQTRAEQQARTAEHVARFMASLFDGANPRNQIGHEPGARELLEQGNARLEAELKDEPATLAYLQQVIGGIYQQLGDNAKAQQLLEKSVAARERLFGANSSLTARSLSSLADIKRVRGNFAEAEADQRRALAIRAIAEGKDSVDYSDSLNNLALLIDQAGRPNEARPIYLEALALREKLLGKEHAQTLITLINLGMLERELGELESAETHLRRVLDGRLKLFGEHNIGTINALNHLAWTIGRRGRAEEAAAMYRHSLALLDEIPAAPVVNRAVAHQGLARVLEDQENYAQAEAEIRATMAIQQGTEIAGNADAASTEGNLGRVQVKSGQVKEGIEHLRAARAALIAKLEKSHPRIGAVDSDLGEALLRQGNARESLSLLQDAVAIRRQSLGEKHESLGWSLLAEAEACRALKDESCARSALAEAESILQPALGGNEADLRRFRQRYDALAAP